MSHAFHWLDPFHPQKCCCQHAIFDLILVHINIHHLLSDWRIPPFPSKISWMGGKSPHPSKSDANVSNLNKQNEFFMTRSDGGRVRYLWELHFRRRGKTRLLGLMKTPNAIIRFSSSFVCSWGRQRTHLFRLKIYDKNNTFE